MPSSKSNTFFLVILFWGCFYLIGTQSQGIGRGNKRTIGVGPAAIFNLLWE